MKTLTIQGVPYAVNDKNEVFLYQHASSTEKHVQIGTYDSKNLVVNLFDTWQENAEERLQAYRNSLKEKTEAAMVKAREIQGISS
jgi:hypothetical protein